MKQKDCVWLVNAMERVYPDRIPSPDPGADKLDAITGGCAAMVVAARPKRAGELKLEFAGWENDLDWPAPSLHALRSVRVETNSVQICKAGPWNRKQAPYLLRPSPFRVFEVILPLSRARVQAHQTQAFLVLLEIPGEARLGSGRFRLRLSGAGLDETLSAQLTVHGVRLPRQRLKVTNWLILDRLLKRYPGVKPWSARHWELIEQALRVLHEGGQNMILLPYFGAGGEFGLIDVRRRGKRYLFDFTRLDRLARMALKMGYQYLEGGHIGGKKMNPDGKGCDLTDNYVYIQIPGVKGKEGSQVSAEDEKAKDFLRQFFPALQAHLAQNGWLGIYYQHIADEPFRACAESFCRVADFVRSVFPGVPLTDAASDHSSSYALDIPIPEIDYLEPFQDFYRRLAQQGKEFWFYVCCCPVGPWPNRFLDFHLNKGGLLPWFNFHYNSPGFLHWGAACWYDDDPYEHSHFQGDAFILYPGKDGILGSMRWLAERIGIEDYELLRQLCDRGFKGEALARRICRSLITDATHFRYDTRSVAQARKALRSAAGTPVA